PQAADTKARAAQRAYRRSAASRAAVRVLRCVSGRLLRRAAVGRAARRASCRRDGRLLAETTTLPHVPRADRRHVAGAPGLVVSVLGQPGGLVERGGPDMAPTPTRRPPPRETRGAALPPDELPDHPRDGVGSLEVWDVAGAVDGLHARARDPPRELVGVDRRHEPILLAPDQERRCAHPVNALLQPLV